VVGRSRQRPDQAAGLPPLVTGKVRPNGADIGDSPFSGREIHCGKGEAAQVDWQDAAGWPTLAFHLL
jgi:hypothetical protein